MLGQLIILLAAITRLAIAIPVDNGVEGDPEIECGASSITVNFNTQKAFEGHVYVKGLYNEPGCRSDENGRQVAGITLPFDSCNLARTRSLNPRGIFVTTTVVISFHPNFVTKVDRAVRIQCFYMEADKTVSAELAVSELTTAFYSQLVPMPICRYEILLNGPDGEPVAFAEIGQQVYHKWTCESETTETFCMVVHSCFVDDGNGDIVNILDDEGCAIDRYVLNNLEYPSDLMAGQEAHTYKYADRSQLFYQCQITITIKEPGGDCAHPQCQEPAGSVAAAARGNVPGTRGASTTGRPRRPTGVASIVNITSRQPPATTSTTVPAAAVPERLPSTSEQLERRKRHTHWQRSSANTMDVRTQMNAFDLLEQDSSMRLPNSSLTQRSARGKHVDRRRLVSSVCINTVTLVAATAIAALFLVVTLMCSHHALSLRVKMRAKDTV